MTSPALPVALWCVEQREQVDVELVEQLGGPGAEHRTVVAGEHRQRHDLGADDP